MGSKPASDGFLGVGGGTGAMSNGARQQRGPQLGLVCRERSAAVCRSLGRQLLTLGERLCI